MQSEVYIFNLKTLHESTRMALDFDELLRPKKKFGWDKPKQGSREKSNKNGSGLNTMKIGSFQHQIKKKVYREYEIGKVKLFRCSQFDYIKLD